jgi:uncharacterized protein (DUF2141 family)
MKKTTIFCSLLYMVVVAAHAQNLVVNIKNIKSDKGIIGVAVFRSEGEFMKKNWQQQSIAAKAGEVQVVFKNLPAGIYAISVMHDENENGKLDSNSLGIPKEGFGFSNDAMGMFGPPSFEKAKFKHPLPPAVSVTLKYY